MGVDGGWLVSKIVGSSATRFTVHPLYWSRKDDSDFERAIELLQPYCSQTGGMYTGSEDFRKHVTIAPALPILQAIPLHEHPLQRFLIECSYMCDGCQHRQEPNKAERFYVCLVCDYGFCTKCFVGAGGVDTHPLPCEPPPAKPIQHENLDRVEFVDELKEHECAVCLSAAHKPVLLPGCGHLFCTRCISQVNGMQCPTCRTQFSPAALQICSFVERQIAAKQVRCLNRAAGCKWLGELGADARGLSDHMLICQHRTFSCPRCNSVTTLADAPKHCQEECQIRDPIAMEDDDQPQAQSAEEQKSN